MARIMLVDDDDLVRYSLAELLRDAGHEISEASSGDRAIKAMETQRFDLIVTDVYMPGSDGIQLAQQARDLYPALKVITISGGGTQGDSNLATRLATFYGADDVLEKPIDNNALLDAISDLLAS